MDILKFTPKEAKALMLISIKQTLFQLIYLQEVNTEYLENDGIGKYLISLLTSHLQSNKFAVYWTPGS